MVVLGADRADEEEITMSTLAGSKTATSTPRRISPEDSLAKVHITIFNDLKDIVEKYLDEMISDVRNVRATMGAWSPVINEAEQILVPIKWLQTWVCIAAAQKRAEISDRSDREKGPAVPSSEPAPSELAFRGPLYPEAFLKQRYDLETRLEQRGLKRGDAIYEEAIMQLNVSQLRAIEAAREDARQAAPGGTPGEETRTGLGSVSASKGT
jgi:hypothetical protein